MTSLRTTPDLTKTQEMTHQLLRSKRREHFLTQQRDVILNHIFKNDRPDSVTWKYFVQCKEHANQDNCADFARQGIALLDQLKNIEEIEDVLNGLIFLTPFYLSHLLLVNNTLIMNYLFLERCCSLVLQLYASIAYHYYLDDESATKIAQELKYIMSDKIRNSVCDLLISCNEVILQVFEKEGIIGELFSLLYDESEICDFNRMVCESSKTVNDEFDELDFNDKEALMSLDSNFFRADNDFLIKLLQLIKKHPVLALWKQNHVLKLLYEFVPNGPNETQLFLTTLVAVNSTEFSACMPFLFRYNTFLSQHASQFHDYF
ncbi:hypothetical protein EIN_185810 [Entamoeba invadens IP1]|uniref:hypothetical protein n=1 Tax=Entamoeba invadens IP1 TaxID=370355 RepID=UPI0002C3DB1A|nr:hypothetical protein EIN_185810 [Entamoeba invadens IP1]ELP94174.1 hypothetical protein EIN_185810 [Entamoeba invadens IP1]|eukprot:XP_004260945.1 hypothetical protein EIN_185810 [Entamoeba invadens IP1]